ncbi:MAG: aspartate aminotransferase family protein, partial [Bacteroidetes bacterium]
LEEIGKICREHGIWLHVDAAYAGSAFILPEYQHYMKGIEHADSFVFNPHKWLYTHFDCSLYYVKNPELLVRTFEILPEYLKTQATQVNNYRDWGIPLGRRFRALKLWFVLRSYGVEGLQAGLREHMRIAKVFYDLVEQSPDFEILAPLSLNLVCFRYAPPGADPAALDSINESLVHRINQRGHIYLTHTRLRGAYTLRMAIGQVTVEERHVRAAWEEIQGQALFASGL